MEIRPGDKVIIPVDSDADPYGVLAQHMPGVEVCVLPGLRITHALVYRDGGREKQLEETAATADASRAKRKLDLALDVITEILRLTQGADSRRGAWREWVGAQREWLRNPGGGDSG